MQTTCYSGLEKGSTGFQQCPDSYRMAGSPHWLTTLVTMHPGRLTSPRVHPKTLSWPTLERPEEEHCSGFRQTLHMLPDVPECSNVQLACFHRWLGIKPWAPSVRHIPTPSPQCCFIWGPGSLPWALGVPSSRGDAPFNPPVNLWIQHQKLPGPALPGDPYRFDWELPTWSGWFVAVFSSRNLSWSSKCWRRSRSEWDFLGTRGCLSFPSPHLLT